MNASACGSIMLTVYLMSFVFSYLIDIVVIKSTNLFEKETSIEISSVLEKICVVPVINTVVCICIIFCIIFKVIKNIVNRTLNLKI